MRWSFESEDARQALDARGAFTRFLHAAPLSDEQRFNAELVFGELFGNVVRHAPGPVRVDVTLTQSAATIVVTDAGPGFELRLASAGPEMESGRGLSIVRALSKRLSVVRRRTGCQVRATLVLGVAREAAWGGYSVRLAG